MKKEKFFQKLTEFFLRQNPNDIYKFISHDLIGML